MYVWMFMHYGAHTEAKGQHMGGGFPFQCVGPEMKVRSLGLAAGALHPESSLQPQASLFGPFWKLHRPLHVTSCLDKALEPKPGIKGEVAVAGQSGVKTQPGLAATRNSSKGRTWVLKEKELKEPLGEDVFTELLFTWECLSTQSKTAIPEEAV